MAMTDKIFYTFMTACLAVIIGLSVSIIQGCMTATRKVHPEVSTKITCIPQIDRAMDPCELEFWEDEEFAKRGR